MGLLLSLYRGEEIMVSWLNANFSESFKIVFLSYLHWTSQTLHCADELLMWLH